MADLNSSPSPHPSGDIAGHQAVRLCHADTYESIGARRRALIAAGAAGEAVRTAAFYCSRTGFAGR
ncbi:hypothetical protein [Sphingomonas profundi]|uniref:hypothetical protein n=1 Tax=Alterirhizorhabdus profundi TaxID=2681549 RepID=UPI0012E75ABA|nr:hypothetical protein [Sphingomonas profundi]